MSEQETTAERTWPVTVKLGYPIQFGKDLIESLTFRRGTMGDLEGATPGEVPPYAQLLMIASRMCGQPVAALKKLDGEDGSEVVAIVVDFLGKSHGVGKTR